MKVRKYRGAAGLAAELVLVGVIGASGAVLLYEGVHAVSCGEHDGSDAVVAGIGAFLLGLAAWEFRRGF